MRIEPVVRFREASFDLTAMIDVVLLLTIFFSMTSQFTEAQNRPMDLPRERGEGPIQEDAPMSLVIDLERDGAMRVLGANMPHEELARVLRRQAQLALAASGAPLEVVVRADRHCASEHLARLGRALADAGIMNWKLATAGAAGAVAEGGQ